MGFDCGGNRDLIQHGVDGYLARPNDYDDLARGLEYCVKFRSILGANGRKLSKAWTWEAAAKKLSQVYQTAWDKWNDYQRPLKIDPVLYAQ